MLTREQKLVFAKLMFNSKETLFADPTGSEVTKSEKASKWFDILTHLNGLGANIPDYKILRDQEWSNMRRAVERKLNTVKSNEGKGTDYQVQVRPFTETEEIVLDILGKGGGLTQKSEIGLERFASADFSMGLEDIGNTGSVETYGEEEDGEDDADEATGAGEKFRTANGDDDVCLAVKNKKAKKRKGVACFGSYAANGSIELNELRRKKLRLECIKLELEIERLPLECAKLELEIRKLQKDLQIHR